MASLRKRGKKWYFAYIDADGTRIERPGCSDKRATEQLAAAAEAEVARVRAGLVDPRTAERRRHAARPLSEHLDDWHAFLVAKGNTAKHADASLEWARRVVALAGGAKLAEIDPPKKTKVADRQRYAAKLARMVEAARLDDLNRDSVLSALAALKAAGRSLATCNAHRTAIRGFSRWAWRDGRSPEDLLAGVTGFNVKEDRRHDRRTLAVEELRRLIAAAHTGPPYRSMSGPARALCYRLAVATGLRYSEIVSTTPASFQLTSDRATITVAAAYTKNGEAATLPLPDELAADLAPYLAAIPAGVPAFPLPDKGAAMLRRDLAAAGIPYRDEARRVFDFHALRCQCATLADQAGVSPRVVQRLMRHSTLELSGRYTRPLAADLERAADALPSLAPTVTVAAVPSDAASGADEQPISEHFAAHLPHAGGGSGREVTVSDGSDQNNRPESERRKSLESNEKDAARRDLTAPDASAPRRTRTFNPLIKSQLLCQLS